MAFRPSFLHSCAMYARPGDQTDSYNQQQQQQQQQHYSSQQVRYLTHHNLPRYPAAPPSTVSSYQPHQVQHGSVAYPPDSRTPAGYLPASGYAGYPSHNHMQPQQPPPPHHPPYYPIRQPTQAPNQQQHPYPTAEQNSTPSQPLPPEASGSSAAGAHQSSRPNSTSSVAASSSSVQQSDRERMMSPNRKPQTPSTSQPNAATDHQSPGPAPPPSAAAAASSSSSSSAGPSSSSAASTSGPPSAGGASGSSGGAVASPQSFPPRHHMRPNVSTPGSDTVNSPAPPTPGASTSSQQPSTPAPATPLPATPSSVGGQVRAQPSPSVQTSSAVQQLTSMVRPTMDGATLPSISNAVSMPGYGSPYNRPGYQMHPTNYPQHVSPHQQGQMQQQQQQQQQMYGNQSHPGTPRPTQNVIPNRPPAPVAGSGGKPHQINNYNSQPHTPQSSYSPAPQAYNTASPAPAPERRLSKQGPTASAGNSSTSGVAATPSGVPQSPDTQTNRQGAAQAAAAAAVVAAAHTALTNSQSAAAAAVTPGAPVKPPVAAGYYPGQPPTPAPPQQAGPPVPPPIQQQQQQQQAGPPPPQQTPQQVAPSPQQHQQRVMTRPNYGPMQPGAEGAPPSAYQPGIHPYSRMPHPNMPPTTAGGMPRMPGHPGMSNSPRMQPSGNMYNHGYSSQHPSQPGPYPGYYPPGGTPEHHPRLPSYPTQMNAYSAPPRTPTQEDTKKAPQARSASQKLAALFEPSDELGRRDFIDRVLKYWEDKNLPLKNAPLMGRKTLDLFSLYRLVKERGFMVEVTNQKKWNEISTLMKLNSSNTSGFTLKKQYCKYLYGFECRFERGEEEPQEALSRITEANRKKKNQADQQNQHSSSMKATVDDLKNNSAVSTVARLPAPRMPAYTPYSRYPGTPQPPPNSHGYVPPQQHYAHPNMNNSMSPKPQMYPSQPLPSYPVHGQPTSYPGAPPNQAPPGSSAAPGSYPPHAAAQSIVLPPQQGGPPLLPSMNSDKSVATASAGNSSHNTSVDGMSQASSSSTSVSLPHSASAGGSSKQQPKPMQGADNTNSNDSASSAASSAVPPSPAHVAKSAPGSSTAAPVTTTGSDVTNANDQQNSSAVAPIVTTGEVGKEVALIAPASHPSQALMTKAHHQQQQQQAQYKMPLPPPSVHPAGAPGAPGTPVSGGHMPYQPRPTHDPTHPYSNRPYPTSHQGMPPPSPFYPGHSAPQQRQQQVHPGSVPGYHHPPDMRRSPYQGQSMHGYPSRPQYAHQQPGYPVPPQQGPTSGPPNQANLKRPGQDLAGQPPNKYPRPEGMAGYYQQSHMRHGMMMPRHHPPYTQSPGSSVPPSSMGMPPHQQPPGTSVMSRGPGPAYHPSSRGSPNVPAGMYQDRFRQRMRWRPPMAPQAQLSRQPERRQPDKMMQSRIAMYSGRRNQPLFPPGSVEATEPKIVKFQRKTCRDVGSLEAWRVIMSLKSGLLVESTWALNVLTILLYDNQTVHQFKLAQLPGLLDSLVDHYRKYLAEFFTLPSEREALGVTNCDPNNWSKDEAAASSAAKDEQQHKQLSNGEKMEVDDALSSLTGAGSSSNNNSSGHDSSSGDVPKSKNKGGGGRKKRVGACQSAAMNSKLNGHHSKFPVKIEHAVNPFVVDKSDLWDRVNKLNATDDLSHIVVSFLQEKMKNEIDDLPDDEDDGSSEISGTTTTSTKEKKVKVEVDDPIVAVEATLEDVLSIPSCNIDVDMEEDTSEPTPTTSSTAPNGAHKPASDDAKITATIKTEPKEATAPATTDTVAAPTDGDKANGNSDKASNGEKEADDTNNKKNEKKQNNKTDKTAVVSRSSSRRSSRNSTKSRSNSRHSSCDTAPANTVEKKDPAAETTTAATPDPVVKKNNATPAETVETKSKDNISNNNADVTATVTTEVAAAKKLVKAKSKIERVLEQSNVVLLESEAIGDEGCTRENWAGATLAKSSRRHKQEIALRLMCVCNIIRSLSFLHANSQEIFRHRPLMRAISGVMLIRHKHRTLSSRAGISFEEASRGMRESAEDSYQLFNTRDDQPINEYSWFAPKKRRQQQQKQDMMEVDEVSNSSPSTAPSSTCCSSSKRPPRRIYSSTVLDENEDTSDVYTDTWWWNHVRRMREDAMVILCNITPCVDLSELPDDHTALAMLEACLHWSTCPSSEASDPFNSDSHSSSAISPQNISLEILTKLSLRDQNVDLMLATKPYSRIEKLFSNLINLISDRKDLALREFSFVLLSNLAAGDVVAARAIAIQKSSINTLISFLEECECTGQHNNNVFVSPQQSNLQCGTTPFMMLKCAKILLSLAKVAENRSSFIRYMCRLMDLSMSKVLREEVVKVMSSILYEASAVEEEETT